MEAPPVQQQPQIPAQVNLTMSEEQLEMQRMMVENLKSLKKDSPQELLLEATQKMSQALKDQGLEHVSLEILPPPKVWLNGFSSAKKNRDSGLVGYFDVDLLSLAPLSSRNIATVVKDEKDKTKAEKEKDEKSRKKYFSSYAEFVSHLCGWATMMVGLKVLTLVDFLNHLSNISEAVRRKGGDDKDMLRTAVNYDMRTRAAIASEAQVNVGLNINEAFKKFNQSAFDAIPDKKKSYTSPPEYVGGRGGGDRDRDRDRERGGLRAGGGGGGGGDRGRDRDRDRDRPRRGDDRRRLRSRTPPKPSPFDKTTCSICREPGHLARNCPHDGRCLKCGQKGHQKKDCPN